MGMLGAVWGVIGVALMLLMAVTRLVTPIEESLTIPWHWYHYAALAASILFMAYSEGYRGFQQRFAPRVAARARYVQQNPRAHFVLLGPFFCAAYFHTNPRRRMGVIIVTLVITAVIAVVRHVAQPWRGIIDAGVMVGLLWGVASLLVISFVALTSDRFDHSPELPDSTTSK